MKNFYVTYKFKNAKDRSEFLREVKPYAQISRQEEGCVRYDYYYPAESDLELMLWEQWETAGCQEEHMRSPHFAKIGELKEKYEAETELMTEETV